MPLRRDSNGVIYHTVLVFVVFVLNRINRYVARATTFEIIPIILKCPKTFRIGLFLVV